MSSHLNGSSICYGVGDSGGFRASLSVTPFKSDGSLCIMKALSRSRSKGFVPTSSPKLVDFLGGANMETHQYGSHEKRNNGFELRQHILPPVCHIEIKTPCTTKLLFSSWKGELFEAKCTFKAGEVGEFLLRSEEKAWVLSFGEQFHLAKGGDHRNKNGMEYFWGCRFSLKRCALNLGGGVKGLAFLSGPVLPVHEDPSPCFMFLFLLSSLIICQV